MLTKPSDLRVPEKLFQHSSLAGNNNSGLSCASSSCRHTVYQVSLSACEKTCYCYVIVVVVTLSSNFLLIETTNNYEITAL